jgi:hypothetical protein
MPSGGVKPIFGLLVLLAWPCLGIGGCAEAGFARGIVLPPRDALDLLGPRAGGAADSEIDDAASMTPPTQEKDAPAPGCPSREPAAPRDLLHFFGCAQGAGMTRSRLRAPTVWGAGLPFVLPFISQVPGIDSSGDLPPEVERIAPSLFEPCLCRPPRAI